MRMLKCTTKTECHKLIYCTKVCAVWFYDIHFCTIVLNFRSNLRNNSGQRWRTPTGNFPPGGGGCIFRSVNFLVSELVLNGLKRWSIKFDFLMLKSCGKAKTFSYFVHDSSSVVPINIFRGFLLIHSVSKKSDCWVIIIIRCFVLNKTV